MKKEIWKFVTAIGVLTLVFVTVWMNRFQYEHTGATQVLVRINRFTGQQCFLTSERGWDSQLMRTGKDDPFAKYGGQELPDKDAKLAKRLFGDDKNLDNLMYSGNNGCQ